MGEKNNNVDLKLCRVEKKSALRGPMQGHDNYNVTRTNITRSDSWPGFSLVLSENHPTVLINWLTLVIRLRNRC